MVSNVIVQYALLLTSIFQFLRHTKNSLSMAAIFNFSKALKKSLAHLHIVGNVGNLNNLRLKVLEFSRP